MSKTAKARRHLVFTMLLILTLVACAPSPHPYDVQRVVVFGDSNVDTGNLARLVDSDEPVTHSWRDRYSNGPVVADYLALDLNAELKNYAVAGATTGKHNVVATLFPELKHVKHTGVFWQLDEFVTEEAHFNPTDLVILWAGSNDIFKIDRRDKTALRQQISAASDNIKLVLERLRDLGARHVIVATRTVRAQHGSDDDLNGRELNLALIATIDEIASTANFNVEVFDAYASIQHMVLNPDHYGFSSNVSALCVDLPACASERYDKGLELADRYINWDFAHKTTRVHRLMADQILESITGHRNH